MKNFDIKMSELRILMRHYGNDATLRQIFEHKKELKPFVCNHCKGEGTMPLKIPKSPYGCISFVYDESLPKPLDFVVIDAICPMCKGEGYLKEDYAHGKI